MARVFGLQSHCAKGEVRLHSKLPFLCLLFDISKELITKLYR